MYGISNYILTIFTIFTIKTNHSCTLEVKHHFINGGSFRMINPDLKEWWLVNIKNGGWTSRYIQDLGYVGLLMSLKIKLCPNAQLPNNSNIVWGFNPSEKYARQNWESSPQVGVNTNKF